MKLDEAKAALTSRRNPCIRSLDGVAANQQVRMYGLDEKSGDAYVRGEPLWFGDQGYFTGCWPLDRIELVEDPP